MKKDVLISWVEHFNITKNSLVILRIDYKADEEAFQVISKAVKELAKQFPDATFAPVWGEAEDSFEIQHFSEEQMNEMGWYRKNEV